LNLRRRDAYRARVEAGRVLPLSVSDYLALEESDAVRHEYVAGEIHAMGGASRAHNKIVLNLATTFHAGLRGEPCEVFMHVFKVRAAQDRREVTVFRRTTGWQGEVLTAPEARVEFRSVGLTMTVAEIYAGTL
jgi:Uma2 family endonuclease